MADPMKQFVVKPLLPIEVGGIDLSFTNASLWMMLAIIVSSLIMILPMQRKSIVPGRWQSIPEILYEFVAGMLKETLGKEGRRYFPFIFTVFMVVLMGNLLGLLPYSFTFTAQIIVTSVLALLVFVTVTLVGLFRHGLHFFSLFVPAGVPAWLAPVIIPIELISYLARPITLAVRLFGNMVAGHTILKVFAGFSVSMGVILGVAPLALNFIMIGFEVMIAVIQAYVFALLSCIYLKDSVELH